MSISAIWRLLTWLPKFILRKIFTKQRLAELILIDVRPRYDYSTINLGEVASYDLWMQAINLSPFLVELDRAEVKLICAGIELRTSILKKRTMASGERVEFYISGPIADGQANHIARHLESHQSRIEMDVEFNCDLHDFAKSTGYLEGLRPRFINANFRGA